MHLRSAIHSFTESILNKPRRGEVRKSLPEVHGFVVRSQLCEFNPVDTKLVRLCQILQIRTFYSIIIIKDPLLIRATPILKWRNRNFNHKQANERGLLQEVFTSWLPAQ